MMDKKSDIKSETKAERNLDSLKSFQELRKGLSKITDHRLHEEILFASRAEKEKVAITVVHLSQVIKRKLYLKRGYSSDFSYCKEYLGYSGGSAARRVASARLSLDVPDVSEKIFTGELSLCAAQALYHEFKRQKELEKSGEQPRSQAKEQAGDQFRDQFRDQEFKPSQALQSNLFQESKPEAQGLEPRASKPLSAQRKKEVFQSVCGKTTEETYRILSTEFHGTRPKMKKARIRHLAGDEAHLEMTLSKDDFKKMKRLLSLLSHTLPDQDAGKLVSRLLEEGLEKHCPVRRQKRVEMRREKRQRSPKENERLKSSEKRKSTAADEAPKVQVHFELNQVHGELPVQRANQVHGELPVQGANQVHGANQIHGANQVHGANQISAESSVHRLNQVHGGPKTKTLLRVQEDPELVGIEKCFQRLLLSQEVRRMIYIRDGGVCMFKDPETGRVCASSYGLDIDHIKPVAMGGGNELSNLRLCCSRHNRNWKVLGEERAWVQKGFESDMEEARGLESLKI
jgi:hypothetical protein